MPLALKYSRPSPTHHVSGSPGPSEPRLAANAQWPPYAGAYCSGLASTRTARLTEAGRALVPACRELVDLAELGIRHARAHGEVPTGRITVTASLGVGERWLGPRLGAFFMAFPDVSLDLRLEERTVDLHAEGVDVAVRAGPLPDSDLVCRRLDTLSLVAVASPAWLERYAPRSPADLATATWLVYAPMGRALRFFSAEEEAEVSVADRIVINNGAVIRDLARQGLGAAMLPSFWVESELKSGGLVPVLAGWAGPDIPLHAVLPHREVSLAVRAFVDHLVEGA